jgi:hypothetical protein
MGFLMDGLAAEGYDRSYSDTQLVRRIFRYFRPYLAMMVFVAVMIFLNAVMDAASLTAIKMPNREGFIVDDRPDVKATRCMKDCM